MTEPEIQLPWYKRPILPPWMPGWLLACVLGGLGFGLSLEFVVKPNWLSRAAIFGIGFLLVLIVLTLAHAKTPPEQRDSALFPPAWIRIPLIVVVVLFIIGAWVKDQIRGPAPPANLPRPEWALWLMAVCGGWLALRFLWIGVKILLSLRRGGEPSGPMRALPMGLSALAGGAGGYAAVVWLWPQAQHGWRQFFPWAAAVVGLVAGLVVDMFLELRSGRWTSWLLSFRLPGYREQLHAPEPGARAAAAKALGGMQKHAVPALPELITALADESADVCAEAALAIYFISWYDTNVPAEVTPYLKDCDPRVRIPLAAALAKPDAALAPEVLPILSEGVGYHDDKLSNMAGHALSQLGPRAAPALPALRAAIFDKHPPTGTAFDALGALGEPGVAVLAEALSHADREVRFMAAAVLKYLGPPAQAAQAALQAATTDDDKHVRSMAIDTLERLRRASEM
jgi:HEAT repeat protein